MSPDRWWITGGKAKDVGAEEGTQTTDEYRQGFGIQPGPPLPVERRRHMLVKIDENTAFLTGGELLY